MAAKDIEAHKFEPGESGNPNGRPKGVRNRQTIVREILEAMSNAENPLTGVLENMPQSEQITYALLLKAKKGDVFAYKELMDSAFGVNKQVIENTHEITTKDIIAKAFPEPPEDEPEQTDEAQPEPDTAD